MFIQSAAISAFTNSCRVYERRLVFAFSLSSHTLARFLDLPLLYSCSLLHLIRRLFSFTWSTPEFPLILLSWRYARRAARTVLIEHAHPSGAQRTGGVGGDIALYGGYPRPWRHANSAALNQRFPNRRWSWGTKVYGLCLFLNIYQRFRKELCRLRGTDITSDFWFLPSKIKSAGLFRVPFDDNKNENVRISLTY